MVATAVLLLVHVPPAVPSVNVIDVAGQIPARLPIAPGKAFTVTVRKVVQPADVV